MTSEQAPSKDLYASENVIAYLRSIANQSIAGRQYAHAADEIERLQRANADLLRRNLVLSTSPEPQSDQCVDALRAILAADPSPSQIEDWCKWVMQLARDNLRASHEPREGYFTFAQISYALNRSLYAKTGNLAIEGIIEDLHKSLTDGSTPPPGHSYSDSRIRGLIKSLQPHSDTFVGGTIDDLVAHVRIWLDSAPTKPDEQP